MSAPEPVPAQWQANARKANFFALVGELERRLGTEVGAATLAEERVRFRHDPAMAFAAGDVSSLERSAEGAQITTAFLGLGGPLGALPNYLSEEIVQEDEDRPIRRALTDVFHHRFIGLFYRLVSRYRAGPDRSERWATRLTGIVGAQDGTALATERRLRVLAALATGRRGAQGLLAALRRVLRTELATEVNVELRELTGGRVNIPPPERFLLGRNRHALRREAVLGSSFRDNGSGVTVVVRGVDRDVCPRLLAGGDLHPQVVELVRLFDRDLTVVTIEVHTTEAAVGCRLARNAILGRTTWLTGQTRAAQVVASKAA